MTAAADTADPRSANDALLSRLDEAKRAYCGPHAQHKDMLRDPTISALVNKLVLLNEPWLIACVKHEKNRMGLRESVEELASTAIAGKGDWGREVGGMMGAILKYDYQQYGVANFTPFIRKAIHDALALTPKETRTFARSVSLDACDDGEVRTWVDRSQRRPESIAISDELLEVLERAIERLPGDRKATARFIVDHVRETGERPPFELVAENHVPPVTRQRGAQLVHDTFDRLRTEIGRMCPDLARSGIGGWQEFNEVFGKHKRMGVGV